MSPRPNQDDLEQLSVPSLDVKLRKCQFPSRESKTKSQSSSPAPGTACRRNRKAIKKMAVLMVGLALLSVLTIVTYFRYKDIISKDLSERRRLRLAEWEERMRTSTTTTRSTTRYVAPPAPRDCVINRQWKTAGKVIQEYCSSLHPEVINEAQKKVEEDEKRYQEFKKRMSGWDWEEKRRRKRQVYSDSIMRHPTSLITTSRQCDQGSACNSHSLYRNFDGSCNNLRNTNFGKSTVPLVRLLPAAYDDGLSTLRTKSQLPNRRLPNPRLISTVIHDDKSKEDSKHSLALMQWGQFLAHDVAMTPKITGPNDLKLACEKCLQNIGSEYSPCSPIPIPSQDYFFPSRNSSGSRRCIPFTRSKPGPTKGATRQQMNVLTAYIDSSNVYGSNECKSRDLRLFQKGKLAVVDHPQSPEMFKPLMPRTAINQECKSPTGKCFFAGEERNSEQPALTSIHTLMMREHNRIADHLSLENPHWSDEQIFQETRKIVMAMNQHITYNEFLPRVLGPDLMQRFYLFPGNYSYDDTCSADIFNEFATAAFRFGHSLIRPAFSLMNNSSKLGNAKHQVLLKKHFFNPDLLFRAQVVDRLMLGILSTPMESFDSHMSQGLTNHLFEVPGVKFSGMDLAAINIQRGRDHGIQGYTEYLKMSSKECFPHELIENIKTFDDLAKVVGLNQAHKLSTVYRDVQDIDLFTGGLSEPSLAGGVVGKTFGCIIAKQFQRLKFCDRFWYEAKDLRIGFEPEQLREIKSTRLSSIICKNWDDPGLVQRNAFDLPKYKSNPVLDCEKLGGIDFSFWREQTLGRSTDSSEIRSCEVRGRVMAQQSQLQVGACTVCSCSGSDVKCIDKLPENCDTLASQVGIAGVLADGACQKSCPVQFALYKDAFEVPVIAI